MGVLALASGEGVSRELLHLAGSEGLLSTDTVPPRAADDAIRRLADAALLTCDRDAPVVAAHPVVRRAVRDWLAAKGGTTALGGATCDMLRAAAARNTAGASSIARHAFALGDHLAPHLGEEDRELAESLLGLRGWAFRHLLEDDGRAGRVAEAGERLVADGERLLGDAHPDTLRARNDLAAAHPETLTVRNNLAAAYLRAPSAEPSREHARAGGPGHRTTTRAREGFAEARRMAGEQGGKAPG